MTIKIENGTVTIKEGNVERRIGNLKVQSDGTRVLRVTRDRSLHLMKTFKAYGFAKELIEQEFFQYLQIVEKNGKENNIFLIEREQILLEGRFYKAPDFEEQVFIPLDVLLKEHKLC